MNKQMQERLHKKLKHDLGPVVSQALDDPSVVEIIKNSDGSLWVEKMGRPIEHVSSMSPSEAESIVNTVASALGTTVTESKPYVECELPLNNSRFTGAIRPLVKQPIFSIRKKALRVFSLQEYVESGIVSKNQSNKLVEAVRDRKNILIVGGTGTGKTTFANALIKEIQAVSPNDRVVIIEDTQELQSSVVNTEYLKRTDSIDMDGCVRLTMRLRPDRVIVGEVRGGEALSLLKVWNTGHPGGLATIHADDAMGGLIRLEQLVAEVSQTPMQSLIASAVGLIVVLQRTSSGRKVSEVCSVEGWDGQAYTLKNII